MKNIKKYTNIQIFKDNLDLFKENIKINFKIKKHILKILYKYQHFNFAISF